MAGVQVTIDEIEVFPKRGTLTVSRLAGFRSTAGVTFRGTKAAPVVGQELSVYDIGVRIFGGRIQSVNLLPITMGASEAYYKVTAAGWEARLEEIKVAVESFQNMSAKEIITALFNKYLDNDIFFNGGGVQDGASADLLSPAPYYPPVVYRGLSLAQILDDLAQRSGYIWYVDTTRELFFCPRNYVPSGLDITSVIANYRDPEITFDRTDYFNKISLAISYDAFTPTSFEIAGNLSWPDFTITDPNTGLPIAVDAIREISFNGRALDWKVYGSESADIYYQSGSAVIRWDPLFLQPGSTDVIRVEFWAIGSNIVEVTAPDTLQQVQGDSGIVQAYEENQDIKDVTQAQEYCQKFLEAHCPAVAGGTAGEVPSVYSWVMYSDELFDFDNNITYVNDVLPGRLINFSPSSPIAESKQLTITEVSMDHIEASVGDTGTTGMFRYTIKAAPFRAGTANYLDFFQALAEVGPSGIKAREDSKVLDRRSVIFEADPAATTTDLKWYPEATIPSGQVFRPTSATLNAFSVSSTISVSVDYSVDGGSTWTGVFASAGALSLTAGLKQMATPLTVFNSSIDPITGELVPLDIPSRAMFRCAITGGAAEKLVVTIVGEVRKENA